MALSLTTMAKNVDDFEVTFELLESDGSGVDLSRKVRTMPYVTEGKAQTLRISIVPPNDEIYSYYSISYLPGKPKTLEGYEESEQREDFDAGYVSSTRLIQGKGVNYFTLHEGDPAGEYRIEVYINDRRFRIFKFYVAKDD